MKKTDPTNVPFLRKRAIELLKKSPLKLDSQFSEADFIKLIHELEVNQIELEIQNEELLQAKEREAELAAEKYIELYDFAPSGYYTLSKEGKIVDLNLRGSKMLGKERSCLKNRRFDFFVSTDTNPDFKQFLGNVFNSEGKENCEVTLTIKGCLPIYIYLSGIAAKNREQCLMIAVDITERKNAEIILKEKNEQIATQNEEYLQMNRELAFQIEEKEKREAELIIANKELAYQNGEKENRASELIIANKELLFQNEEKEKRAAELFIANKELAFQNTEKEKRAAELIIANNELAFQNREKEKREDELILANKELAFQNEEKENRAAELFIAKGKAEESDRLKSAFLANMSHEIRTPMNGILGFAELLKEPELHKDRQQSYISTIEKSGMRMLNIINDIITISKVDSGQMAVSVSDTNINEQIEYIYTFFKPEVEHKGIQISYRNALPEKEAIIQTDREKIYAILTNLVKNAIKFTQTGSIEYGYEKEDNYLRFYVKDTGIGIRHEKLIIIFERFRQGSESLSREYEGAGLGLSISKAYVEMLGGKIWVESEEGKGSEFFFTIPYQTKTEDKIARKEVVLNEVEKKMANKLKILIAEDNEESEMLLSMAVKKLSKKILIAKTGLEAVEVCHNNPDLDLVLMDIKMPEMNGYEATRQIRQFNKDLIIVAQTAFALSGDRENAIAAGCTDYISKPIRKDNLMAVVQKYF